MTSKQVSWVMFGFSLVISFVFLSVLVKTNYDLDQMRRAIDQQQKQIEQIKKTDDDTQKRIADVVKSVQRVEHEVDITQELQRKQAQVVVDIKKGRKK